MRRTREPTKSLNSKGWWLRHGLGWRRSRGQETALKSPRTSWILPLIGLLLFAPQGVSARGKKKKKSKSGPAWPVPNPSFAQPGFNPSTNNRQISGIFGPRVQWGSGRYDHHEGLDFYAQFDSKYPQGDHPVTSILPGVVSQVIDPPNPERTETGRKVVVTHNVPWTKYGGRPEWGKVQSAYLHLSVISVTQGQALKTGDEIGRAGATGYTSTVHLHLNCYRAGGRQVHVNPGRIFSPKRFPAAVAPLHKQTIEVTWLERNVGAGTALVRVILPFNAYTLDGFVLQADKDTSRGVSFEQVSAKQRDSRDTGDKDLFPGMQLFPLKYNGGGGLAQVNARGLPSRWPAKRYPAPGNKASCLAFDILATGLPPKVKKFKLIVLGCLGEKVTFKSPGWQHLER